MNGQQILQTITSANLSFTELQDLMSEVRILMMEADGQLQDWLDYQSSVQTGIPMM